MTLGFTVFETSLGWCALAWSEAGIVRGWLPVESETAARASVARRCAEAVEADPPGFVADAVAGVKALMAEGTADLNHIRLDLADIPPLHERIYEIARAIPPGEVLTYGEVAERAGDKNLAREVGRALGLNPFPPIVPCHRILAASGKTGGFSAPGGVDTKMRLLNVEKARTSAAPSLFDDLPLAAAPRR
jgi:methylated-DNA-[protein]-cysteine S-methyltransferase